MIFIEEIVPIDFPLKSWKVIHNDYFGNYRCEIYLKLRSK